MENIKKTLRFLFITFAWSLFYFGLVRQFFFVFDKFDILRKSHWLSIYYQWINGWILKTPKEQTFFLCIILFLPIWGFCLYKLLKFEFTKSIKEHFEKKKKEEAKRKAEAALYNPPKIPIYRKDNKKIRRPPPLRALSGAKFKDKAADKGVEDKKVSKKQEDISKKISEDDGILSEEEIFSDIKDDTRIDDLPEFETSGPDEKQVAINGDSVDEILINAGYKISKKIEFEESTIDFLAYSSELVLLVKYFDDDGQWLADEIPFRDEDPQWFSETSQKTSPVKEITNLCEKFEEKINGMFSVVPVLIITKANIMNAEEISKTWEELGVIVALSEDGGPSGILPEVGEAIPYADGEVDEDKMKEVEELL